ncbi:hypothetical protein PFICI_11878 [Pestalotiopsis fici W106-1]|uniref:Uncharacterized protein n=1 Tax=Pestalotiopsis fici (strain W106-1 / CGMCC3.15140) TaxID=1229662 RepID=W3WUE8_PESFW|nr:uncharacterized protein PFICI_11878 [Pestalotiopsis fici W106-1]ETS76491.1 hypothetical protein PFICI_11878 [Pestalotiopsis fici W106-1]
MGQKGGLIVMESAPLMDHMDHKDNKDCMDYRASPVGILFYYYLRFLGHFGADIGVPDIKGSLSKRKSPASSLSLMMIAKITLSKVVMEEMDETGEMDVQVTMGGLGQVIWGLLGLMVDLGLTLVRAHKEFQGSAALKELASSLGSLWIKRMF